MTDHAAHTDAHGEGHAHHVVSMKVLAGVFVALLVLTVVTYLVSLVHLGDLNLFVAMAVALVKATLVALYFMHLRWDSPFNSVLLVAAVLFVTLFIGLSILDTGVTKGNVQQAANVGKGAHAPLTAKPIDAGHGAEAPTTPGGGTGEATHPPAAH